MESELFGYDKGAFTGASAQGKPGLFELADKGTLFLDEVGELQPNVQVALLRAVEAGEIRRVGATRARKVDVRIVAATNRDLQEMVRARLFREDLFFRLNVFPVHIPPLRERPEDVLPLAERFLRELNDRYGKAKRFRAETLEALARQAFPGNVRDLQNLTERAFILADGKWIEPEHLPPEVQGGGPGIALPPPGGAGLTEQLEGVERAILERAIAECGTTHAMAKRLGVNQSTIVRKLQKLGLRVPARSRPR
jgi:transcriptional regulator with PAS, ATPase and Fis domain